MNRKMMIPALAMGLMILAAAPDMKVQAAGNTLNLGTAKVAAGEEYTFSPSASYYYEFAGTSSADTELTIADASGEEIEWAADSYDASGKCVSDDFDTVVWLEQGTSYQVRVDAETAGTEKAAEISLKVSKASVALKSVSSGSASGVTVTWEALNTTSEPCYAVFRKSGSGKWARIGMTYDTTYLDTTAKAGTTYSYTVRACAYADPSNYAGSSYNASGLTICYLAAIRSLTLTNTSAAINVRWSQVTGAEGYYVYRKSSSDKSLVYIGRTTSGSTVSFNDKGVVSSNGTSYTYAVRAYRGTDRGAYSGVYTYRLTAPTLSALTNTATRRLTVKWAKNASCTGYVIQYGTSSTFSGASSVTVKGNTSVSKVLTSLTKGKTYYVRVRAYRTISGKNYYSTWSSSKTVKITK